MTDFIKKQKVNAAVMELVADALSIPSEAVTENLAYGDIPEWDSLGHMNIIMALEDKYSLEVTADFISSMTSIVNITNYIMENEYE